MKTLRSTSLFLVLAALIAATGWSDALAQSKSKSATKAAEPKADAMTFHIYKDAGGKYRWRLMDGSNAEVGMANKGYAAKADCQKVIDAIIAGAAKAKVEDDAK